LREGCIWRIGDGKIAKLWHNQWVSGHRSLGLELGEEMQQRDNVVASIVREDNMGWDLHKLRTLFNPMVVVDILKVMVFPEGIAFS